MQRARGRGKGEGFKGSLGLGKFLSCLTVENSRLVSGQGSMTQSLIYFVFFFFKKNISEILSVEKTEFNSSLFLIVSEFSFSL